MDLPTISEYRFVDPGEWDGIGEIVEDVSTIDEWRRELGIKLAYHIEVARAAGQTVPATVDEVYDKYSPSGTRTMLVRIQVHGPMGKN